MGMGYRWKVGNGRKIRFWEDNWLGSYSLAIQFWPIYKLVNEKNKSIAELWDGHDLKCTFRRTFTESLYNFCLDILELISTISLNESSSGNSPLMEFTPLNLFTR